MSGIAFQKLNGEGTVASEQLDELKEINSDLDNMIMPDLYKMAKLWAKDMPLTPVVKTWFIDKNNNADENLSFDGLHFGHFRMHHEQSSVGDSDNSYRRSIARLIDRGNLVAQTSIIAHGDDIMAFTADHADHVGFADSLSISSYGGDADFSVIAQFIGFEVKQPAVVFAHTLNFDENGYFPVLEMRTDDNQEWIPAKSGTGYNTGYRVRLKQDQYPGNPQDFNWISDGVKIIQNLNDELVVGIESPFFGSSYPLEFRPNFVNITVSAESLSAGYVYPNTIAELKGDGGETITFEFDENSALITPLPAVAVFRSSTSDLGTKIRILSIGIGYFCNGVIYHYDPYGPYYDRTPDDIYHLTELSFTTNN